MLGAIAVALLIRLAVGNPNAIRHRTRTLRWRIRLYLGPGHGYANMAELAVRWSPLRAVWTGRRARPSLPWWARAILPVTTYAVRLGRAQLGKRVIASMEDQVLVLAPPRTGKSGWLADRIIDHPGAVVTTTTRTDLLENTGLLRARRGRLHVFNPEGIGGTRRRSAGTRSSAATSQPSRCSGHRRSPPRPSPVTCARWHSGSARPPPRSPASCTLPR